MSKTRASCSSEFQKKIRFGTCKVRRLNQLSSTDLYLGRPAVLFDRACRTLTFAESNA